MSQEIMEPYRPGVFGIVCRYYDHSCECCGMDGYIKETFHGGPVGHPCQQGPGFDRFFYKNVEPDAHVLTCINCDWELGQPCSENQRQEVFYAHLPRPS